MMLPPLYAICSQSTAVVAVLGTRIYAFGEAPQDGPYPYATWSLVSGTPENYHDCPPDVDSYDVQVDVWGGPSEVQDGAEAMRDALEPTAYVTAWRGSSRDKDAGVCRYSFDVAFIVPRD